MSTLPPIGTAPAPVAATSAPAAGGDTGKIHEAASKLEGLFMSQLVERMLEGTGMAEKQPIYSGLLTEKLGDHLASVGGIGLAAIIESQLGGTPAGGGKETP